MAWLCGQRAYFILPPGWTGTCAPIFISDHTFRMSAVNSCQTTRRRRDVSAVQPHDPIYGSDVPEEFKLWTTGQKVLHSLFPWVGTGKNMLKIETLDYRFGLFLNASCKINDEQNQEIDALRIAVMQHRVALDMILAEKGGLCILFNNTCCTYIPDNVHSSNMTDALRTLKQLRDAQQQDYVTNTEDWLTWLTNMDRKVSALRRPTNLTEERERKTTAVTSVGRIVLAKLHYQGIKSSTLERDRSAVTCVESLFPGIVA
ncbi:unnamed protein product [Oreochromis niloticus]|nr:unnamed protein product [Mustela putorius furo]